MSLPSLSRCASTAKIGISVNRIEFVVGVLTPGASRSAILPTTTFSSSPAWLALSRRKLHSHVQPHGLSSKGLNIGSGGKGGFRAKSGSFGGSTMFSNRIPHHHHHHSHHHQHHHHVRQRHYSQLSQTCRRHQQPPSTNHYHHYHQQQQQQRNLSFLGTLRAVFKQPTPPLPPKQIPKETRILNGIRTRIDEFAWMSDSKQKKKDDDDDLQAYIEAENIYAKEYFASESAAIHLLSREMRQVLSTKKVAAPIKTVVNGFEYYTKTSRNGLVWCRRRKSVMGKEEILLDSGYLPDHCAVKRVLLSPNHQIFAFLTEDEGQELGALHFRDLNTQQPYDEVLEDVFNFVWGNNNQIVYYTKATELLRPYQVWAHRIGTNQTEDVLVFEDLNQSHFVDVGSTKDHRFVTINANSLNSSEVRVLDASFEFGKRGEGEEGKLPELKVIEPRQDGVEYYVDHHDDHFYILTNANRKKNFRFVKADGKRPGRESWIELVEAKDGEKIEDVDIFKNFAVIYSKREALPVVTCYHFQTGQIHEVPLPETFCTIQAGINLDYETDNFQFTLNSPYAHEATYEYDMASRVMTPLRVHPIHKLDRSKYTCTRINVPSEQDPTVLIPVTLLHKKTMQLHGRNPTLMRGYGAYGVSTEIDFKVEHFPLLDRGWIIALTHVRGGSELGTNWYHDGKMLQKQNSFKDFISVAEYLCREGYTNPRRLTAMGTSAGGLLVGAVSNWRPDLFNAVILNVPFLDPLGTMLDDQIPLTRVEFLEWGNPKESREVFDYMKEYSPYDTIPICTSVGGGSGGGGEGGGGEVPLFDFSVGLKSHDIKMEDPIGDDATTIETSSPSSSSSSSPTTLTVTNLESRRPAIMITGGELDQRVDYTQATKYVARLRSRLSPWYGPSGREACVLMIEKDRGHFGNSGSQEDRIKSWARELVFLLGRIQM